MISIIPKSSYNKEEIINRIEDINSSKENIGSLRIKGFVKAKREGWFWEISFVNGQYTIDLNKKTNINALSFIGEKLNIEQVINLFS